MASSVNRITGAVSGWDTDSMVKSLMKLEQAKSDKVKQDRQVADWQKDAYKEFSTLLRGLQSEFFDVLKPSQNLRSTAMFNLLSANVTVDGAASTKVSAVTSSNSVASDITISRIDRLATKDTWTSGSEVKSLMQNGVVGIDSLNSFISQGKDEIQVTVDGVSKTLTLAGNYADINDLSTKLQAQFDSSFGSGKVTVGVDGGSLSFASTGHTLKFSTVDTVTLSSLGLYDGASNTLRTDQKLSEAFNLGAGAIDFSINGVTSASLGITGDTTVSQLMEKINSSSAGVTLRYSTLSNGFTMTANSEGAVNDIQLTDGGGFFANTLKLSEGSRIHGQDAEVTINGVDTTRSSNTFAVDGTTITLNAEHTAGSAIKIGFTSDTTQVSNAIKGFVDKYNELVAKLGTAIGEKRNYSYKPLTDEQKEGMSEDDIKLWETKAKSGLLRADPVLLDIQSKMRRAFTDSIEGVGLKMTDIGITTSANYLEGGKLILNENKLKSALQEKPNEVVQLFTKQSTYNYTDGDNRGTRYNENGVGNRLNDILNDNIRLSRDSDGNRGVLIDKAGSELNTTDTSSYLAKKIADYDDRISKLLELLSDREEKYYDQFGRMETALQKLNAQSTSLVNSLGGS